MPVTLVQQSNRPFFNVKDFGAAMSGNDDSAAFTAAYTAAGVNGGTVYVPPGTLLKGNDTLLNNVLVTGAGKGATIIKLKNSTNADLFSASTGSISLSAASGIGSTGGAANFGFINLTLDGNKSNQTSGPCYPLRFYGRDFTFENFDVQNGFSGGILCDWNGGAELAGVSDQMEARFINVKIHDCTGIGLQMGGPHDSQLLNVLSYNHTSHAFHLAPNAAGTLLTQCHPYNLGSGAVGYLVEAGGVQFNNCISEGSTSLQTAIFANNVGWSGGEIYTAPAGAGIGIQLGQQSGQTPIAGQILQSAGVTTAVSASGCTICTIFTGCQSGAIYFANESQNIIIANIFQSAGTALVTNHFPASTDHVWWNVNGLTSDHTMNTSSTFSMASSNTNAFVMRDGTGTDIFGLDGIDRLFNLVNGCAITGYSDNYTTVTYQLKAATGSLFLNGTLGVGPSATAAAIATAGTIVTGNIGEARVAPTAAVTGIILTAGAVAGQIVTVVNESAFTLTFAASGTSFVADGVANIIPPTSSRRYIWDSSTSLWYGQSTVRVQSALQTIAGNGVTVNTAGIDVARTTMTAARTGAILQAGTYAGQQVCIINESTTTTFTINWAASGTSNVAQGVSVGLNGLASRIFVWDSGTSLWY